MIELIDVNKTYNGKIKAVDSLSLTIPAGQIIGFLGPNGAGKTTTIKLITGILKPDSGTVKINGIDNQANSVEAKKQFGFVPDNPDIFLRLKGIEYLNFMADVFEISTELRRDRIEELARKFEMTNSLNDKIQSYSHGMRQKIVIIGSLIHEPSVWILDEPLTGLDPKSSFLLKEIMRDFVAQNRTVFFSTHILEVAEKICDKVAIINKGKILFFGTIEQIKDHFRMDESLEKMFLELTNNE